MLSSDGGGKISEPQQPPKIHQRCFAEGGGAHKLLLDGFEAVRADCKMKRRRSINISGRHTLCIS